MRSQQDEEQAQDKEHEAFLADMKIRLKQAQASGKSPEQIRELILAITHEEGRKQAPQIAARARSWWTGFRNFLIIGALAFGLAIGLALFVDHYYASPLCEQYAVQHSLLYRGLDYPVIGKSSSTSSSGSCIFEDSAGQRNTIDLRNLEPNAAIALLASFGLQIEFTIPALFIVVALIAVGISKLR